MPALKNAKHERFALEFIVDENASKAARRAGYSERTAGAQAHKLLKNAEIGTRIAELRKERSIRTEIEADEVLQHWHDLATADPNELVQNRAGACRYCYGVDHEYQWKTPREFREACDDAARAGKPLPSDAGGYGYRLVDDPNPECPECSGLGINYVLPLDTRRLSPKAQKLFAGVKQTKDGLEIKMRDQDKALENVARHLGMFKEQHEHDITDRLAEAIKAGRKRARQDD